MNRDSDNNTCDSTEKSSTWYSERKSTMEAAHVLAGLCGGAAELAPPQPKRRNSADTSMSAAATQVSFAWVRLIPFGFGITRKKRLPLLRLCVFMPSIGFGQQ